MQFNHANEDMTLREIKRKVEDVFKELKLNKPVEFIEESWRDG